MKAVSINVVFTQKKQMIFRDKRLNSYEKLESAIFFNDSSSNTTCILKEERIELSEKDWYYPFIYVKVL